jgi:hypothetical protein
MTIKEIMLSPVSIFANPQHRISAYRTYFRIVKINRDLYQKCKQTRVAREAHVGEDELAEAFRTIEGLTEEQWQAAMIAVTFAAMTLEAFFFDYAADTLGDEYVKDHLDKLDLPSKYLVYPKLVCGAAPNKGEHTFELVRNLTRLRNDLVHAKSKAFTLERLGAAADHYDEYHARLDKGVDEAIECVLAVMRELDKLHGTEFFEKNMLAH